MNPKDRSEMIEDIINDDIDTIRTMLDNGDNTMLYNMLTDRYENQLTEEIEQEHRERFEEKPE